MLDTDKKGRYSISVMTNSPASPALRLHVRIAGYVFPTYTKDEAIAHFRQNGDPRPDVYLFCGVEWANANDGEAVWSTEHVAENKDLDLVMIEDSPPAPAPAPVPQYRSDGLLSLTEEDIDRTKGDTREDYEELVRGTDAWWDRSSYIDAQLDPCEWSN